MPSATYVPPARAARRAIAAVELIALVGLVAGVGAYATRPGPPDPGLRSYDSCAKLGEGTGFVPELAPHHGIGDHQVIADRDPGSGGEDPVTSAVRGSTLVTLDLRHGRRGGAVHMVDVGGGEPRIRGRFDLPPGERATGLFALGPDRTLVLSFRRAPEPAAVLTLVDAGGPGGPRVVRRASTAGTYLGAWRYGPSVRLAIAAATGLPVHTVTDGAGTVLASGPVLGCADVLVPRDAGAIGLVTVADVALEGPGALTAGAAFGVLADTAHVLSAGDRTYVTTTLAGEEELWTAVHAFAGGRHVATGSLPGRRTGPWSRSPSGLLRVVTEAVVFGPGGWSTPERLTLLAERDGGIVPAGAPVEPEGSGTISEISWAGDLAEVTTAGERTWVETFDLTDPARPRRLGGQNAPGPYAPLDLSERLLTGRPATTAHPGWRRTRAQAAADYPARRLTIVRDWVRRDGRVVDVVLAVRADPDGRLVVTGRFEGSRPVAAVLRAGPRLVVVLPHAVVVLVPRTLDVQGRATVADLG